MALVDIHEIIEKEMFLHYSQSIFRIDDWTKIGNEILLRSVRPPETIFSEAKKVERQYELEIKSILKLLQTYPHFGLTTKEQPLFINLYPSTILASDFPRFITELLNFIPINRNTIVFEILETEMFTNIPHLRERITFLKNLGFLIAIDDVGVGLSSLDVIIELEPHYIKLDKYFSIYLSQSPLKQQMIKSLLLYAKNTNTKVILEGIENAADLATAKFLGIENCQGFLLDKPKPITLTSTDQILER